MLLIPCLDSEIELGLSMFHFDIINSFFNLVCNTVHFYRLHGYQLLKDKEN